MAPAPPVLSRLPSSTVASFLLRSLQTHTRPSLWATRPPAVPCAAQCRRVHLYKTARSNTLLGQHKILAFNRIDPPELASVEHKFNLWNEAGGEMIAKGINMQELTDYIHAGKFLLLVKDLKETQKWSFANLVNRDVAQSHKNYYIASHRPQVAVLGKPKRTNSKKKWIKQLALLKEIPILLSATTYHFQFCMDRAYAFIDAGHPVEFSVRIGGETEIGEERLQRGHPELFSWMFSHFPHMRPDVILKCMPAGTHYVIEPFGNGGVVKFVLGLSVITGKVDSALTKNYTERVLFIKNELEKEIEKGGVSQLPKEMRKKLIAQGNENYSLDTGRPKPHVEEDPRRREMVRWGRESLEKWEEKKKVDRWYGKLTKAQKEREKAKDVEWAIRRRQRMDDTIFLDDREGGAPKVGK